MYRDRQPRSVSLGLTLRISEGFGLMRGQVWALLIGPVRQREYREVEE